MKTGIKKIVQDSALVGTLSFLLQKLMFRISVKGQGNILEYKGNTIFWDTFIRVKGNNNRLIFGSRASLKHVKINILANNCTVTVGDGVKFYEEGNILIEGDNGAINVGELTTIGSADLFIGEANTSIKIGTDCMFSREITVHTTDFHSIVREEDNKRINIPKSIVIGDHVWIGLRTHIGKGTVIGANSVVASHSNVTGKEFGSNLIIGGIPAKEIKSGINWSREKLPY